MSVLKWQRLALSSWSKSFSRSPEKIFRALDVQLIVKFMNLTQIHVLKRNVFTCFWFCFRPQIFHSYNQDVLVKLRRIAVFVVVLDILFRLHAPGKFQEAFFLSRAWRLFLHCLSLKCVVSDHFWWGNVPFNQNKLRMCLHFHQNRTRHRCLKLSNDWNYFYKTTNHLQQFIASKFSSFFKSEASRFPRLGLN